MKNNTATIMLVILVILLTGLIGLGFTTDPEYRMITKITTHHSIYWRAYYSDLCSGIDCEHDYWDERVSNVHYLDTKLDEYGFYYTGYYPEVPTNKSILAITPEKYPDIPSTHLDYVYLISVLDIRVWYDLSDTQESYNTISQSEYDKYSTMIGKPVEIGTWWGIRTTLK